MNQPSKICFYDGEGKVHDKFVTKILVNSGIDNIPEYAFLNCERLSSIYLPESIKTIGDWAFSGCCSLVSISIPESTKTIGKNAFNRCFSLSSINIPDSVTAIDNFAFYGCSSLSRIKIPRSVKKISVGAFSGCSSLVEISIPPVTIIGDGAFSGCSSLSRIKLPQSVTTIGVSAFRGCSSLVRINIAPLVKTIDNWTFYDCSSLTEIKIPQSVTRIGVGAFIGCFSLTTIEIPEDISIGENTFERITIIKCTNADEKRIEGGSFDNIGAFINQLSEVEMRTFFQKHNDVDYWINPQNRFVNQSIPLQQLAEADCSFNVIHTFISAVVMKDIEKEHPELKTLLEQIKSYFNHLLKLEVDKAVKEGGGLYPIWKARIAVVGSDRSGKTSTIRSIKGEKYNAVSESTVGLDMTEADVAVVRELGIDVYDVNVSYDHNGQKLASNSWNKVEKKDYDIKNQSIRAKIRDKGRTKGGIDEKEYESNKRFEKIILKNFENKIFSPNYQGRKKDVVPKNIIITPNAFDCKQGTNDSDKAKVGTEQDNVEKEEDLEADLDIDSKIRISIWDNGGQAVFQTIQHLYIGRKCCYIVVFNLVDFLGDEITKKKATDHLHFWLQSIKHHGVYCDENEESKNPSVMYPPVILVGTHLDKIEKMANEKTGSTATGNDEQVVNQKLHEINTTLINELGSIGIFSTTGSTNKNASTLLQTDLFDELFNSSFDTFTLEGLEFLFGSGGEINNNMTEELSGIFSAGGTRSYDESEILSNAASFDMISESSGNFLISDKSNNNESTRSLSGTIDTKLDKVSHIGGIFSPVCKRNNIESKSLSDALLESSSDFSCSFCTADDRNSDESKSLPSISPSKERADSVEQIFDECSNSLPNIISIKGREFLYNSEQGLCYWPIDNRIDHGKNQSNIPILRSIIVRSIMEDPLDYANDPIPTAWLDAIDGLSKIASKEPILPLNTNSDCEDHTETSSVISVLSQTGALNNISDPKSQAVIFMKYCHQFGFFVYFDTVPGLQDHCILNPQWLIDKITCVIRDIKLHQLPSDNYAMKLNGGKYWIDLRDNGILDLELLQEFWSNEDETTFDFLIKLMIELKIFGVFTPKIDNGPNRTKFIVPSVISSLSHAMDAMSSNNPFSPRKMIDKYLQIFSSDKVVHFWDKKWCEWSFFFSDFLPVGCYNQLVASLVNDWKKGYLETDPPKLLPTAAMLCMGPNHRFVLVIDILLFQSAEKEGSISLPQFSFIKIFSRNEHEMITIIHHISSTLDAIIKNFYKGKLQYQVLDEMGMEIGQEQRNHDTLNRYHSQTRNWAETFSNKETREKRKEREMQNMIYFFQKHGMSETRRDRIVKLIFQSKSSDELTPAYFYELYETEKNKKKFKEEIIKGEFGIHGKLDILDIERVLKKCDDPVDYMIGFFGGDRLKELDAERYEIRKYLFAANLKVEIFDKDPADLFQHANNTEYKVLHIAMHGASGKLSFQNKFGCIINIEDIVKSITNICKGPKECNGSILCVFLNGCELKAVAEELHIAGVKYVLCWKTHVNDNAAREFAGALYQYLGGKRDNMLNFKYAYDKAVNHLILNGWLLQDPTKNESVAAVQKEKMNPRLKAAGIPFIFEKKEKEIELLNKNIVSCQTQDNSSFTHTIHILNDITTWPSDGNGDLHIFIVSDQFLNPKGHIQLSKNSMNKKIRVTCIMEERSKTLLQGHIIYRYRLLKKRMVVFHLKDWNIMKIISLTKLDSNSEKNINQVRLMRTQSKSNKLSNLPQEYQDLYSREAYKFLITGCTMKDSWGKIQTEGYNKELHDLFSVIPNQKEINCCLFTVEGDTAPRNFAFARIDGTEFKQKEFQTLAKYVRRMFSGLYNNVNAVFKDTDKDFLTKLDKVKKMNIYCTWTLQEYKTEKWFYNELQASDKYQEVIFSSQNGSVLRNVYSCTFSKYIPGSNKWPAPSIEIFSC